MACDKIKSKWLNPKHPGDGKASIMKSREPLRYNWKKEIDLEYEFYLASLRAQRDSKYLVEERDLLIANVEAAQILNVELRTRLRGLERELYTMCHKNAHNSCVIDGLQELDEQMKQTKFFKESFKHKLYMASNEQSNCEEIISMLKFEISLLKTKNEVDAKLIESLKPHDKRLNDILDAEVLKNHQNAQEFIRELEEVSKKCQEKDSEYDALMLENAAKVAWLEKTAISKADGNMENEPSLEEGDEEIKKQSSEKLKPKKGGKGGGKGTEGGTREQFKLMQEETAKLITDTEQIQDENDLITNLISDCLPKSSERFGHLVDQSLSLYGIDSELALVREYIDRLNKVRLKQETQMGGDDTDVEELDELQIILSTQTKEGEFFKHLLEQSLERVKDYFQMDSIILNKIKEQLSLHIS